MRLICPASAAVPVCLATILAIAGTPGRLHAQDSPAQAAPAKPAATKPAPAHHRGHAAAPAKPRATMGAAPTMPAAAPPVPVIPPPDAAPAHPVTPPPPPPVHADAPGDTSKITDGLRLTFGDDRSDFNPATQQALVILAHTGIANANVVYNIYAHAHGTTEDTSTPRRLSLERALSVRSALIHAGIPSIRIYVHALGANGSDPGGPPADRVDVTIANLDTTPPAAAPRPAAVPGTPPTQN